MAFDFSPWMERAGGDEYQARQLAGSDLFGSTWVGDYKTDGGGDMPAWDIKGTGFGGVYDVAKQLDPSLTEDDMWGLAQSYLAAGNDLPGKYMPSASYAERLLSHKYGTNLRESNPQLNDYISQAENMANKEKLTWKEAWPILAVPLLGAAGAWAAPALAGAAAGEGAAAGAGAAGAAAAGEGVTTAGLVAGTTPAVQAGTWLGALGNMAGLPQGIVSLLNNPIVANMATSAVRSGLTGASLEDALKSAMISGAGGVGGSLAAGAVSDYGPYAQKLAGNITSGGISALLSGRDIDPMQLALGSAVNAGKSTTGTSYAPEGTGVAQDWTSGYDVPSQDSGGSSMADDWSWDPYGSSEDYSWLPPEYSGDNPVGTGAGNMEGSGTDAWYIGDPASTGGGGITDFLKQYGVLGQNGKMTTGGTLGAMGLMALLGMLGNKNAGVARGFQGSIPSYAPGRVGATSGAAGRRPGGGGVGPSPGRMSYQMASGGMVPDDPGAKAYESSVSDMVKKMRLKAARGFAGGGYLGGSDDGMADTVPAQIEGGQPAALSHGEFVIPADVVADMGNGNSNAGAEILQEWLARVRSARHGSPEQGKQIDPQRLLPAA